MGLSLVVAVQDAAVTAVLEELLGEESGFQVRAVADSPGTLVAAVLDHEPDAVLLHEDFGPQPALAVAKDLVTRLPWVGIVLLAREATLQLHTAADDVGVRGIAVMPPSLSDLSARLGAAAWWSRNVRNGSEAKGARDGAGTVLAIAGAKGGVGVTSIATQLAFVAAGAPKQRVCLVDLDLFGAELAGYLGTTAHRSLLDLVHVSDELGAGVLLPTLYAHESGVRVLFTPPDIADAELVTPSLVRRTIGVLRTMFDVVVVDCGSHVNEAVLPAVELADRVALVVTPDLLAVRAAHRIAEAWERLDVRRGDAVELLVNRVSRSTAVQPRLIGQTSSMKVCRTGIPAAFGALEPLANEGAAALHGSRLLNRPFTDIATHFGVRPPAPTRFAPLWRRRRPVHADDSAGGDAGRPELTTTAARAASPHDDRGSVATETAGAVVVVGFGVVLLAQLALIGTATATLGIVAPAAARDVAAGASPAVVQQELRSRAVPVLDEAHVHLQGQDLTVSVDVPLVVPLPGTRIRMSSDAMVAPRDR